jgi:hypothetical protein
MVFFALGTAETLFDNAAVSILPAVVPRDQLARANSRLLGRGWWPTSWSPRRSGGAAAAAAAVPFLLDAGTFAAAAALAVAIALMNLTLSATLSLSVLYPQERFGLGSVGYGLLLSSMAVGGIAASLVADRVIGRLGPATTMRVGLVIESSTHLVLALAHSPFLVGVTFALFGFGSLSLGAVAGGLLAARYGLTAPFWCSFVLMTTLTVACWPILSARAIARAHAQAPAQKDGP